MAYDFKKEQKEFYKPKCEPEIVNVPKMNFITVRGSGDPNEEDGPYQKAISILYNVGFTLKMSCKAGYKIKGFFEYSILPLEGFWWQDGIVGIDYTKKNAFRWVCMMRVPDFVTKKDFEWAIQEATHKKQIDCSGVTFHTVKEGLCCQIMHVGRFDDEPATVEKMYRFMEENGYVCDISNQRFHHEIYLSDPRKTAPEKCKTIIRLPIKKGKKKKAC